MKSIIYEFVSEDELNEEALNNTIQMYLSFMKRVKIIRRRKDMEEC